MPIQDIISAYHLSPDAEERISKNMLKSLKGSVRINLGSLFTPIIDIVILGVIAFALFHMFNGIVGMLILIVYLLGAFLVLWELFSYRIDFDGSTGFIQYHTLFRGTRTYHVDELMLYDVHTEKETYGRHRHRQTLRTIEVLEIHTADGTIKVPISSVWLGSNLNRGVGGYRNADKLYTYLEIYRRYAHKSSLLTNAARNTAQNSDLAPSVQAAIKAQQEQHQAAFAPAPEQQSIPELTDEDLDPASLAAEKPAEPALSTPDISVPVTGEPETHVLPQEGISDIYPQFGFPDPAQKQSAPSPSQKPTADVDQLFENILRQHGKL